MRLGEVVNVLVFILFIFVQKCIILFTMMSLLDIMVTAANFVRF